MRLSRKARWAVPAAAVVVTGGVIAGSAVSVAQAAPALPARTPAQLLADVAAGHQIPPLTGTVVETTSLGLPALPQTGNSASLSSLLTGSHTLKVYFQDARHFRLAVPQNMSETDLVRDGSTAWLWDSVTNSVDKFQIPAGEHGGQPPAGMPALTPQQAASRALAAVGKDTNVSVQSTLTVAGEAAYQLVLSPKDARSTIGSVRIAIDGKTGVPLRVQVFAAGAGSPAFQVGYTDISYVAPNPANFTFNPPPGATVHTAGQGGGAGHGGPSAGDMAGFGMYGTGWLTVAEAPKSVLTSGLMSQASGSSSATTPAGTGAFGKDGQQAVSDLLGAAKPVSGAWGSGMLLHTSLVNILFVGHEMYLGAVSPSVLYDAVGHASPAGHS